MILGLTQELLVAFDEREKQPRYSSRSACGVLLSCSFAMRLFVLSALLLIAVGRGLSLGKAGLLQNHQRARSGVGHIPLVMRVGKGNGKLSGGMRSGNSIMRENKRRRSELKDPAKIFVGNLAWNTSKEELTALCRSYGDVAHVKIVRDHFTRKSKVSTSKVGRI